MIAIGASLRRRGFEVVISLAEPYAEAAEKAGLIVEPVISRDQFNRLLDRPSMWRPLSGIRAIMREVVAEFLPVHFDVIRRHHRPGETVLVAHPLDFASRTYRDLDSNSPLVSVHLAPSMIVNPHFPPKMSPWWFEVSRPPWAVRTSYYLAEHLLLHPCFLPRLNSFRRSLGLGKVDRPMKSWWMSPDAVVLMYPQWFAPEQTAEFRGKLDERFFHAGFPLSDFAESVVELQASQPIVFTCGTAHHHAHEFFRQAVNVCQTLQRSGVLLTSHPGNLPVYLPSFIQPLGYVSLAGLLQQSAAIVHHGGIGTTSQALAAGVPQLVRPLAYDQFDNATRVEKLGVGCWLRRDREMPALLARILGDDAIRQRCAEFSTKLSGQAGAETAADRILTVCGIEAT